MFRTQRVTGMSEQLGGRSPGTWLAPTCSPRGFVCTGLLVGVSLFGLAAKNQLRAETATRHATGLRTPAIEAQLEVLLQQLDHPEPAVRREAIVRLSQLGSAAGPAIPRLIGRLQDRDLLVRAHAARAVCRLGLAPEPVVPILAELLRPKNPQLCGLASLVLGEIGPSAREAVPALRTCLRAATPIVRLQAAEAILKIAAGDSEALHELLAAVADERSDLRYVAVNALGTAASENEQAVFALEKSLTDDETNVAAVAGLNLSQIDDRLSRFDSAGGVAVDAGLPSADLTQWIANLSHSSAAVRQTAAIRLAMAGPSASRAVATLRDHRNDRDLVVRVHVARALWIIEPAVDDILPVLVDLLDLEKPNVRVAAAYILGRMGPQASAALPSLRNMLSNSDLLDRLLVAGAISRIDVHERGALAILVGGLRDPEADVRYLSAVALGDAPLYHQRRLERALTGALGDRNLRVQAAAAEALARVRDRIADARTDQTGRRGDSASVPETNGAVKLAHAESDEPPLDAIPPITDVELTQATSDKKD